MNNLEEKLANEINGLNTQEQSTLDNILSNKDILNGLEKGLDLAALSLDKYYNTKIYHPLLTVSKMIAKEGKYVYDSFKLKNNLTDKNNIEAKTDENNYNNNNNDNNNDNNKKTINKLPPKDKIINHNLEKFSGFEKKKHIALIGTTDSGKTTSFCSFLFNGLFKEFDSFVLVGSDLMTKSQIDPIRESCLYNLQVLQNKETLNKFSYYKSTQMENALNFMGNENRELIKLGFIDDSQLSGSKQINEISNFINQAKNANCGIALSLHEGFKEKAEQTIRDACKYKVLFNQTEVTFNRLLNLQKGNMLWKKYNMIQDLYDRVLIYDRDTQKSYYGFYPYLRMDPLINNADSDKIK